MKYLFCGEEQQEDNYNPKLYIKSNWEPPIPNNVIESNHDRFEDQLTSNCNDINSNCKPSTNITQTQEKLLHSTCKNKNIVILQTDKNLGAATMEWDKYVNIMLDEHLLNGDTYELLFPQEATHKRDEFKDELIDLITFEGDRVLKDNEK